MVQSPPFITLLIEMTYKTKKNNNNNKYKQSTNIMTSGFDYREERPPNIYKRDTLSMSRYNNQNRLLYTRSRYKKESTSLVISY